MNLAESLPKQLGYTICLVINRLGEFYLCIPESLESGSRVIDLDP
ncbi:4065_t:CDS:2, partial [Gigaspora margarita]